MNKVHKLAAALLIGLSLTACSGSGTAGSGAAAVINISQPQGREDSGDPSTAALPAERTDPSDTTEDVTDPQATVAEGGQTAVTDPSEVSTGKDPLETQGTEGNSTDPTGEAISTQGTDPSDPGTGETADIPSNLPEDLRAQLEKSGNAILLIYHPEKYPEIQAITRWTVTERDPSTELLLVTRRKGSLAEVAKAELTDDERVVIPGEVIRDWRTTSDYEAIRIVFTDPEVIPTLFVSVREPDGRSAVTALRKSLKDDFDWQVFPYTEEP